MNKRTDYISSPENEDGKFAHKKSLGQNFLTSDIVPNWMCEAGEVQPGDLVLEIGPGTGMLTRALLARKARVIAVEADIRAVLELEKTFAEELATEQLTIHHGDVREITPAIIGLQNHAFKVVANIPYYLSGFLLRTLLESQIQPTSLTFLIQKELAHRIVRDKKESLLSLSVKAFGEPVYFKNVGRGHFHPQPRVDSAILLVKNINQANFTDINSAYFFDILHLGLGKKRKQLLTNLSEKYDRSIITTIFTALGLSLTVRGEDVPLPTWISLVHALSPHAIHTAD
jgi:16S rRNA (adenine1518-N6/adenine1519-N6)-dimethyltransferase